MEKRPLLRIALRTEALRLSIAGDLDDLAHRCGKSRRLLLDRTVAGVGAGRLVSASSRTSSIHFTALISRLPLMLSANFNTILLVLIGEAANGQHLSAQRDFIRRTESAHLRELTSRSVPG